MDKNALTVIDGFMSALIYLEHGEPPTGCSGTLDDRLDMIPAWYSARKVQHGIKVVWNLLIQTGNPAITSFLNKSYEDANDLCFEGMIVFYIAEDDMVPSTLKQAFALCSLSYVVSRLSSREGPDKRDVLAGMRPWQALMKRDENKWALLKDLVKALVFTEDIDATSQSDTDSITTTNTNHDLSGRDHLSEETTSSNALQMTSIYRAIRQYIYRYHDFWFKLGDGCSPVKRGDKCISRWNESLHKPAQILEWSVKNLQCANHNQDPTYHGIVQITLRLYRLGYLQSVDVLESYIKGVADLFFEDSADCEEFCRWVHGCCQDRTHDPCEET
ncbi:hypothetical protein FOPG_19728 [Fusarium oxysporum f. sp. conglutinans race 2 54008]|uniref:Uncharacterized protein n=2 Tax=Fusarium oxysporum f. sp. conglutinans TaxID=100902 RepID=F9G725_FUSOF|nr:hypothetical protein FOXB_14457 [Fusarium oxysporum f. sp. conglutinans Fo5176]EXL64002.1 hypothetical protein FOPG_19728 [Fusarium oxysporum f. sp. conglutinans race 2 54008]